MNSFSLLESTLKEILKVIKPQGQDWDTRICIIAELREVVQSVESLRGATVEPFGSLVSNLFTRWGDLDISIELPIGAYISSSGKKRKQSLLGDLLKALKEKGGFRRLQFIPNARVPILKFESSHQGISCDISMDNLQGQMKSKFLFWINEIDGRFREMVLLVKEWAKAHNINNPKCGTFNSYSLSLMIIFHFQTCVPAILPPLQDLYPGNVADDLIGVRADAEKRIAEICACNISKFRAMRTANRSSLSELFISFIAKFSDINVRASELGICPFTGRWEAITNNMRWLPRTYAIFVEDPFEQPENTARAVSAGQLKRISEAFETTRRILISGNQSQSSLLTTLVRPQTLRLLTKSSIAYPNHTAGHNFTTHTQVRPAVHSPSPMHHQCRNGKRVPSLAQHQLPKPRQFPSQVQYQQSSSQAQSQNQKGRLEIRSNSLVAQRRDQRYHTQVQQVWKPKT